MPLYQLPWCVSSAKETTSLYKLILFQRQALEQTLDIIQKEDTNIRIERAEAIRQNAVMETKITEAQVIKDDNINDISNQFLFDSNIINVVGTTSYY